MVDIYNSLVITQLQSLRHLLQRAVNLLALAAFIIGCYPKEHLAPFVPPPERRPYADDVRQADVDVIGVIVKVDRDRRYEPPCGFVSAVLSHCLGIRAYRAVLLTVEGKKVDFLFFVNADGSGMGPLTRARFLLHYERVLRSDECSRYGCQTDYWLVVDHDSQVLPL
jgi:hypothetical protein